MVLTQQAQKEIRDEYLQVSIPLWFLRNLLKTHKYPAEQHRFHTTMVLTQPKKQTEEEKTTRGFPYHYGSYATVVSTSSALHTTCVSIPLWFLRNAALTSP